VKRSSKGSNKMISRIDLFYFAPPPSKNKVSLARASESFRILQRAYVFNTICFDLALPRLFLRIRFLPRFTSLSPRNNADSTSNFFHIRRLNLSSSTSSQQPGNSYARIIRSTWPPMAGMLLEDAKPEKQRKWKLP
jgi:hypothetical protein